LSDRFVVRAICDPVQHRAEQAASTLGAEIQEGFRALTARHDIDAVLLLSARWFGSLPILAACEARKAIYCAAALHLADEEAGRLRDRVRDAGIAFMAEFPCRLSPATLRLKELLATRLGPPRLVFCNRRLAKESAAAKSATPFNGKPLGDDLVELIDWVRYVVDREPESVLAVAHSGGDAEEFDYMSMNLEFPPDDGRQPATTAIISCGSYVAARWQESLSYRRPADLKVVCERGIAFVDLPHTLSWFDEAGHHIETLDHDRPVGEQLLVHFHRAVESLVLKTSSLDDAYRAIALADRARQSAAAGKRMLC
jgi:predicted dehydrogenase